jgi:hypothetical protein
MHDAGARVAALPAEAVVEADAEATQLCDPGWSLLRQQTNGAGPAKTASGGERVLGVKGGIVVGADGRRYAALGRVAVRATVRGLREHEHRGAGVGCRKRCGEAGDTGSGDDRVGALAFLPHNR